MAISQIATSVTILNSKIGYNGLSLSNRDSDSAPVIYAGGIIEIANGYFYVDSDATPNASAWTAVTTGNTAYITLTPSGTAGSQVVSASWSETAPEYIPSKGGWYLSSSSNIRYAFSAIKHSATSYGFKQKLMGENVTTGGTTIMEITGAGGTTTEYSADFVVSEPCSVYGEINGGSFIAAGNIYLQLQAKIDGTYIDVADTSFVMPSATYGLCICGTASYKRGCLSVCPGTYRLYVYQAAATAGVSIKAIRAGRLTDVTQ